MFGHSNLRRRAPSAGFSWGFALLRAIGIAAGAFVAILHYNDRIPYFSLVRVDADIVGFTMLVFWLVVIQRVIWERLNSRRINSDLSISRSILHDLGEPPDSEASKRHTERGTQLWDLGMVEEAASAFAMAAELDSGNYDAIGRAGLVELSSGHIAAARRYARMLPVDPIGHGAGDLLKIRLARRDNDRIFVRRTMHIAQEATIKNLRHTRWLVQYASEAAPWEWPLDVTISLDWTPAGPLEEACFVELLFKAGDRFEAMRRIRELTERQPNQGFICLTAARLHAMNDDEEACVRELRRGIEENPLNVPLQQTLLTHLKRPESKERGLLAHRILKLQPTNRLALVAAIGSDISSLHWIRGLVLYLRLKRLKKGEHPGPHTAFGWYATSREDSRVWRQ